jgi:DNA-binding MarR family transcriptional regulator
LSDFDFQGDDVSPGPAPDAKDAGAKSAQDRRWRELLELDARIFKQRGVRLLTPEARVLFFLSLSGPVPVSSAMRIAGTSYRAFYAVLARLKEAGMVNTTKDSQDQRIRNLSVDGSIATSPLHP